jgi:hypothetical protein
MPERLPEFPVRPRKITRCLDGLVYLASADRSARGTVIVADFGHEDALTRARTRARALDDLDHIPAGPGFRVAGVGVASGQAYLMPVEAVWARDVASATVGVVEDASDPISSAIADVLAHHVVTAWWGHPMIPLLRVTSQLREMSVIVSACAAGLAVSAYVLPGQDFQTVLVSILGRERVVGMAAGRLVASTAPVAFLRALAAMARPPEAAAAHLAWTCRAADITWLERCALDADLTRADELAFWEGLPDWADIASRQFGHEPVIFSPGGHPAKVVCPGAAGMSNLEQDIS